MFLAWPALFSVAAVTPPPGWGDQFHAAISANLTQVGYDAGLVIVNFSSACGKDPRQQRMLTVYGDFDTVLTRCDLGMEFIIAPPSRGGGCTARTIGRDVDSRICAACGCPFCVRDTNGSYTHGEAAGSATVWQTRERLTIDGVPVDVWRGRSESTTDYALHTDIGFAAGSQVPVLVNVSHPLWVSTSARLEGFTRSVAPHAFDIPSACKHVELEAEEAVVLPEEEIDATDAIREEETSSAAALMATLQQRVAALEANEAARARAAACVAAYPSFPSEGAKFAYAGYDRNVKRNATTSVDVYQTGVMTVYNTSSLATSGLFDVTIAAHDAANDAWHFVCAVTPDEPHRATCTLTYETPERPEGPAWLSINFDVAPSSTAEEDVEAGACETTGASLVGTYFYSAMTNDAGVYHFHATAARR